VATFYLHRSNVLHEYNLPYVTESISFFDPPTASKTLSRWPLPRAPSTSLSWSWTASRHEGTELAYSLGPETEICDPPILWKNPIVLSLWLQSILYEEAQEQLDVPRKKIGTIKDYVKDRNGKKHVEKWKTHRPAGP
jgi:hypothetical protein